MHRISFDELTTYLNEAFKLATDDSGVIQIKSPDHHYTWIQGYADKAAGIPLTLDTKFQIASITKQFTAVALLMALEKARHYGQALDEALHKPLNYYIPDFEADWAPKITLHHILTHTSGVDSYTDFDESMTISKGPEPRKNLLAFFKTLKQDPLKVGKFHYCNTGYALLEYVIENLTGLHAGDFMKTAIFSLLNMSNTSLPYTSTVDQLIESGDLTHMARGYAVNTLVSDFQLDEIPWYEAFEVCYASGGIISTVPDLILWTLDLCKDNKVVPKHIAARVLTKHVDDERADEGSFGYGYGIGICQHQDAQIHHWRHTGLVYGYESVLAYYDNLDIILVNLSNCIENFYERTKIRQEIRKELSHITDEAEQDQRVEKILDERYPDRLAMMDRIYPKPVRHFERFLKGE